MLNVKEVRTFLSLIIMMITRTFITAQFKCSKRGACRVVNKITRQKIENTIQLDYWEYLLNGHDSGLVLIT